MVYVQIYLYFTFVSAVFFYMASRTVVVISSSPVSMIVMMIMIPMSFVFIRCLLCNEHRKIEQD